MKTSVKSLPKPYETNCLNFRLRHRYVSKLECIDECKIGYWRSVRGQGFWPGNYLAGETLDVYPEFVPENITFDRLSGDHCKTVCPEKSDCYSEYYGFKLFNQPWLGGITTITIMAPELPDIVQTHSPKILFEEFVSYVASYVSLWFGFSFVMLSNAIHLCFEFFVQKFKIFYSKNNNIFIVKSKINVFNGNQLTS